MQDNRLITSDIVQSKGAGNQSFSIADGNIASNFSSRLDGASLLVVYSEPSDSNFYRLIVYQGLDFAYNRNDQLAAAKVTDPVIFNYVATGSFRTAELVIFAGDGEPQRPDRIDITDAFGNVRQVFGQLEGFDCLQWDTIIVDDVQIPAGGETTKVQLFSEPIGQNPDSLLWVLGALRLPVEGPTPTPTSRPACGAAVCSSRHRAMSPRTTRP